MKIIYTFLPFILFCALTYTVENKSLLTNTKITKSELNSYYTNGLLTIEKPNIKTPTFNKIEAELNTKNQTLFIKQNIIWINKSEYATDKIFLKFDINALKNNYSEYATKNYISKEERTGISNLKISVNNLPVNLHFINDLTAATKDSTNAYVLLDSLYKYGDTVKIISSYSIRIPKPSSGIGFVQNRNFYFFNDWFIKIPPFILGKWYYAPTPGYLNYFEEFANFDIKIKIPKEFKIGASANILDYKYIEKDAVYSFKSDCIKSFSWFCGPDMIQKTFVYKFNNRQTIISIFVQPEKEGRIDRYKSAIFKSLDFLNKRLGSFPYETFTVIDLPRTFSNISNSYTNMGVIKTNLFSPEKSLDPETELVYFVSRQYFENILSPNSINEPWIALGLSKFYASKIIENYYGKASYSFKLASYIPIYGLNFISYNEIPLIYSLGNFKYKQYEYYLPLYYKNHSVGSLNNNTYEFPTNESYFTMSTVKPEIALLTLENIIGKSEIQNLIRVFYNKYKFKHATSKSFFETIEQKNTSVDYFFENVFMKAAYFDYRIKYVKKVNKNNYDVYAERLGDGVLYNKVALYTDKDTLYKTWDDDNKWKIFRFFTKNEVLGAEIDPEKINLLDINIANNSYLLNPNYLFPFSLTVRWFFWIQNALMILGSIV